MKNIKQLFSLVAFALLTLTFTSCEKEGDAPAYVGTWVNQEIADFFGMEVTVKTSLTLTESTFVFGSTMIMEGTPLPMGEIKGDLSVSGDTFTIKATSITSYDENGNITVISKGDAGWEKALLDMEMSESESATFSIAGNEMTITFDGETESVVFTKQ